MLHDQMKDKEGYYMTDLLEQELPEAEEATTTLGSLFANIKL